MSSEEKAGSAGAPSEGAPSQQPETPKPKPPRPANMKYHPGETIEAKDFDGKWYPAQISEIDWNDKEILVHFEKCDEWIQMDSSRLRHLPKPPQQPAVTFTKGEEVIAPWSSTRKYPATIQVVHANGRYDVLFHDGSFKTKLPGQKISKLDGQVVRNDIPNFTNIGTKEERRERKRKINIAELFHINKRSKKKGLVHSKSPDVKTYTVNRSRVKKTLPTTGETEATDVETEGTPAEAPATPATPKQPEAKPTTNVTPGHGSRNLIDTVPCPVQVTYKDGRTEMWSKHLYQRSEGRTAGKLDIVIMNPKGKKFRCRNEIMKYCEENKINYSPEAFDFSAKGRPKSKPVIQTPPAVPESPQIASSPEMEKPPHKKPRRKSHPEEPIPVTPPVVPASPVVAPPIVPLLPPPPVELLQGEAKIFIGDVEVRTDNGKLICPVKECSKHFRRENLLHMHMKHYHPEFSKFLDYTPSVTDLAYARTVGSLEPMDGPQQASRKSFGIEKPDKSPVKPENSRKSITAAADVVKESKKAAKTLEPKNEAKASPSTAPAVTSPIVEDRVEDNKAKIANDLLEVQRNSLLPESLPPTSPNNRISRVEESQNEQETETAPKTLPSSDENKTFQQKHRHRRSGRYQGPFSHHSRKRKYSMLAEQRRSNYKMAKKEPQTPPPPLPAPFSSPVPPHSLLEDQSNSNASSQSFPVARYQKQQSLVSNEISGKNNNHLLTSSRTFNSTAKRKKRRKHYSVLQEKNKLVIKIVNTEVKTATRTTTQRHDNNSENNENNDISEKRKRSLLAGVLNFRRKREKQKKNRMAKKKHKKKHSVHHSGYGWVYNAKYNNKSYKDSETDVKTKEKPTKCSVVVKSSDVKEEINAKNFDSEVKIENFKEEPWEIRSGDPEKIKSEPEIKTERKERDMMKAYVLLENVMKNKNYFNQNFSSRTKPKRRPSSNNSKKARIQSKAKEKYYFSSDGEDYEDEESTRRYGSVRSEYFRKWNYEEELVDLEEDVVEDGKDEGEKLKFKKHNEIKLLKKKPKNYLVNYLNKRVVNKNAQREDDPSEKDVKRVDLSSCLDHTEGTEDSKSPLTVENDKFEKLRRNEIINCCCGLVEEDGLMIQCDLCLCWQHGHCANILRDTDVPDKYICSICKNPFRGRLSMKYLNDQEWLKEGTLPRSKREDVINARKAVLKRSYDLSGSISLLAQVIYSLRVKLHIAEKKDHPKLWLWAKKWSEKKFNSKLKDQGEIKEERLSGEANGDVKVKGPEEQLVPKAPEPEAPIDSAECRLNLLDHLIHYQTLIDARLSCIESLVAELESVQEDAMEDETPDEYPRTKATVQMLLRDLNTVKKIAAIS